MMGQLSTILRDTVDNGVKPLFIPLKTEFYDAFERGDKTHEYRIYGPRWNERTCVVGRAVVLSKGYGTKHRLKGVIKSFKLEARHLVKDWDKVYGNTPGAVAADIEIEVFR